MRARGDKRKISFPTAEQWTSDAVSTLWMSRTAGSARAHRRQPARHGIPSQPNSAGCEIRSPRRGAGSLTPACVSRVTDRHEVPRLSGAPWALSGAVSSQAPGRGRPPLPRPGPETLRSLAVIAEAPDPAGGGTTDRSLDPSPPELRRGPQPDRTAARQPPPRSRPELLARGAPCRPIPPSCSRGSHRPPLPPGAPGSRQAHRAAPAPC